MVMNRNGNSAAGKHRPGAIGEAGDRGHAQIGQCHANAYRERRDGTDLQKRRKVIARRQQQPHRQHARQKSIADQHQRQVARRKGEPGGQRRVGCHAATGPNGHQQQRHADARRLQHLVRPAEAAIKPHAEGDRDRGGKREYAPRRVRQRLDHDQPKHRQKNNHDGQHADRGHRSGERPHFAPDHIAKRVPVPPHRKTQYQEILHGAREHHAGQNPERAGQISHLRGKHGPHERPGAGDGGEMVSE